MKSLFILAACIVTTCLGVTARDVNNIKPRIIVSTDIGGTDPDDNQSMTHFLMYNSQFDIEGIISSASYGPGSKEEILRMIDIYEADYEKLKKHDKDLLAPQELRKLCKQGRRGLASYKGTMIRRKARNALSNAHAAVATGRYGYWYGAHWKMWPRHCTTLPTSRTRYACTG